MKILITGICGFVGSTLARAMLGARQDLTVMGVDNFIRPGSEINRLELAGLGVKVFHGDLRNASDFETLPACDWVIDAAANPSVLAGVDGQSSSRQVLEHNLGGTFNTLEYCKTHRAGFILLSTSRVYAIKPLAGLAVEVQANAYRPRTDVRLPPGLSAAGVSEDFSTSPPVSLYGSTKLASEVIAIEYGETFEFPVWVNRCGVLAGAGQFGKPDQGIFAFWINAHLRRQSLRYIGFDGLGHQVRDCLHPRDLLPLLQQQLVEPLRTTKPRIVNVSGGVASALSLRQLTEWCDMRSGAVAVGSAPRPRPFDLPWVVLDSRLAFQVWGWQPQTNAESIFEEILLHARANPNWLQISATT
jgi:CDP-paratose 2-epimerase